MVAGLLLMHLLPRRFPGATSDRRNIANQLDVRPTPSCDHHIQYLIVGVVWLSSYVEGERAVPDESP